MNINLDNILLFIQELDLVLIIVFFSVCIFFFFCIFNKSKNLIFSSNITIYHPISNSIISVSIRFMGLLALLICLLISLNCLVSIDLIYTIEFFRFSYFILFITMLNHFYETYNHAVRCYEIENKELRELSLFLRKHFMLLH